MVRPKKHLGQHFLTEESVAKRIADAVDKETVKNLLEIGPGKGVLTKYFIDQGLNLKVVELDQESVEYLNELFPGLAVLNEDFLQMDLNEVFSGEPFNIVGNFPYNISSQIVFKTLEYRNLVSEFLGMFQREVAKRICAEPGNKDYGILSVLCQACYHTKYLFTVSEGVFFPPPKVKSGVIRMRLKEDRLEPETYEKLRTMVKMAFNQRRKQLRNSIKSMLPEGFEHEFLTRRPEELQYTDFLRLIEAIGS